MLTLLQNLGYELRGSFLLLVVGTLLLVACVNAVVVLCNQSCLI